MDLLRTTVKNLYIRTGQFNLYVCCLYKKDQPDIMRLKKEVENIKQIILNVETEIKKL